MKVPRNEQTAVESGAHDFDLHGVVGIRLLDATAADVATVRRQLGPLDTTLLREPDITIRFVHQVTSDPMTFVGIGDTGFNAEGFYVLRGKGGVAVKVLLPLADIGNHPCIVCERPTPAVPHLLAIINLTALTKGVLPLHASAFTLASTGVLVTGWAKGGKTESLLAAMGEGGRYVGDEWVYLTPDRRMLGLPEPIRLWAWHLDQLPALRRSRPFATRVRLSAWSSAAALTRTASALRIPARGLMRRAAPLIGRQAFIQIPPGEMFGTERVALEGDLDTVVLVVSHSAPDITVTATGRTEVSGRMRASLAEERASLMAHYRQFQYAFPGRSSAAIDNAPATEARLLSNLFDARPAVKVAHPYPCDIAALGMAVRSAALGSATARAQRADAVKTP